MDNILSLQNFENALERKHWTRQNLISEYNKRYSDGKGNTIENTLKKWLAGNTEPGLYRFSRLCDLLDCDIDYLLGSQETPRKEYAHISEITGLSYNASEYLTKLKKENYNADSDIISALVEDIQKTENTDAAGFMSQLILCMETDFYPDKNASINLSTAKAYQASFIMDLYGLLKDFISEYRQSHNYIDP